MIYQGLDGAGNNAMPCFNGIQELEGVRSGYVSDGFCLYGPVREF